jgi:hypothetical protein
MPAHSLATLLVLWRVIKRHELSLTGMTDHDLVLKDLALCPASGTTYENHESILRRTAGLRAQVFDLRQYKYETCADHSITTFDKVVQIVYGNYCKAIKYWNYRQTCVVHQFAWRLAVACLTSSPTSRFIPWNNHRSKPVMASQVRPTCSTGVFRRNSSSQSELETNTSRYRLHQCYANVCHGANSQSIFSDMNRTSIHKVQNTNFARLVYTFMPVK